jgi:chromosome segregation ATPase
MNSMSEVYDLRDELKKIVEFIKSSEQIETRKSGCYRTQVEILEKRIEILDNEISEYDSYVDQIAEKFDTVGC